MSDPTHCSCPAVGVNSECPVHNAETEDTGLPKYDLRRAVRSLDRARDSLKEVGMQVRGGILRIVLVNIILAIYHIIQYIRAKERQEI